jgi:hypothetical protein
VDSASDQNTTLVIDIDHTTLTVPGAEPWRGRELVCLHSWPTSSRPEPTHNLWDLGMSPSMPCEACKTTKGQ